jgi:hypothetical protein
MNTLKIEATEFSPSVFLSSESQKFEIAGESRPENTQKFYTPIIEWLDQYKQVLYWEKNNYGESKKIVFDFKFDYFNSSSAKYIMDILYQLESYYADGYKPIINWYYDAEDEDMKDAGEEFSKLIKVPIQFIEK